MSLTTDISKGKTIKNSDWEFNIDKHTGGDKVIWALVVLLTLVSLLAVYSATGSLAYKNYKGNTEIYLFKQVLFILIGFAIVYFFAVKKSRYAAHINASPHFAPAYGDVNKRARFVVGVAVVLT